MRNAGAEYGSAEGWDGLENFRIAEFGIRLGQGRTGDYAFAWRGQSSGISSGWIPIDREKAYELSGWFKSAQDDFKGLTFGLLLADEQQSDIKHVNVFSVKDTYTRLVEPCRAGDRLLYVEDGANWRVGTLFVAAFGANENELTFDITPGGVEDVRRADDQWVIVLNVPCGMNLPADTPVHQNRAGNNGIFLPGAVNMAISDEWTEVKGVVGPRQWWPGTAYARVVVIGPGLRLGAAGPALLVDDFGLKEYGDETQ